MKQKQMPKQRRKAHKPKERPITRRPGARIAEAPNPIAGYDLFDYPAEKETKKKKTKE
jgi:hypothetical protein